MNTTSLLTTNALAFIGLCNEYCSAIESAGQTDKEPFVKTMLRLLPRIYIAASDLTDNEESFQEAYIEPVMDEELYNAAQQNIAAIMGEDDTYLEVFEEDMKYSDTPIAANISEGLADLFQVFYNFVETIKEAPETTIADALTLIKEDFGNYWSQILCNVLRALNQTYHNIA